MSLPWAGVDVLRRAGLTGSGVGVGHLDSGVDVSHPALAGCIARHRFFDRDGRVVRRRPFDDGGHGTHTAGIIAGRGISARVGLAPGCRLHVAHVLEHGRVIARALRGLHWLGEAEIRVLAMPLGIRGARPLFAPLLGAAVDRDILPIAPIGNLGHGKYHVPGGDDAVLSVGAIDDRGRVPQFSGSRMHRDAGCLKPDLLAPGVDIESAEPGGGVDVASGTSMAAAFVAGVAALLFEARPGATATQVRHALVSTATPLSKGRRHRCRGGVIDPVAALACLRSSRRPTGERPPEQQPPRERSLRNRVDPRLQRLMTWTPTEPLAAIALMHDPSPHRARRLLVELGHGGAPARRVRVLGRSGLVLLEAEARVLDALSRRPELRYLSAQDVDLY